MKKYNIAKNFSINVCGLPIPKNALYGKYTCQNSKAVYWYLDDYAQFKSDKKSLCVYLLQPQDTKFRRHYVARRKLDYLHKLIVQNNLQDTICIYPLKIGRLTDTHEIKGFISAKQAQVDFIHRPSNQDTKHAITDYACGKMPNWVAY